MASGAGLNRVFRNVLTVSPSTPALTTPLVAYGVIGVNDTGMLFNESMAFTKFTYQIEPADNYSITLYGTVDRRAYDVWRYQLNPNPYLSPWNGVAPVLPASSWFVLPGPSEQSGTGTVANPMTVNSPTFTSAVAVLAIRAVLTSVNTPTQTAIVSVLAVA